MLYDIGYPCRMQGCTISLIGLVLFALLQLPPRTHGMQVERACIWTGDFPRCRSLSAADSWRDGEVLLDLDGAVVTSMAEAGEARSNFVLFDRSSQVALSVPSSGLLPCFILDINFHLGTRRTVRARAQPSLSIYLSLCPHPQRLHTFFCVR